MKQTMKTRCFVLNTHEHFLVSFISGWVGALSAAVALFISPITIGVCKRKSTRLTAVIGGKYLLRSSLQYLIYHLKTSFVFTFN